MSKTQQIGKHKTTVFTDSETGTLHVRYHNTSVVEIHPDYIMLDTGGWATATTKLRMNQASNQFGLGYRVYQKDHDWYVTTDAGTFPFDSWRVMIDRHTMKPAGWVAEAKMFYAIHFRPGKLPHGYTPCESGTHAYRIAKDHRHYEETLVVPSTNSDAKIVIDSMLGINGVTENEAESAWRRLHSVSVQDTGGVKCVPNTT